MLYVLTGKHHCYIHSALPVLGWVPLLALPLPCSILSTSSDSSLLQSSASRESTQNLAEPLSPVRMTFSFSWNSRILVWLFPPAPLSTVLAYTKGASHKNIARSRKAALRNLIGFGGVKLFLLKHIEFVSFVTICVFEFCNNLNGVQIWVFSQFEFLSFVTILGFEFGHNLSFWVLSQFEGLSFVTIWRFEFCHNLSS